MDNRLICNLILQALKISKKDVISDFEAAISTANYNGLPQVVWARRAQILENLFVTVPNVHMLHIKRGFWEINPIFDALNGTLYLTSTKTNFINVRNKYQEKGTSTHYIYSLLMYNIGLVPQTTEIELFPVKGGNEQRILSNQKMLGENYDKVKRVYVIVVDYSADKAIEAEQLLLNDKYELVNKVDLTAMLQANHGDNLNVSGKFITPSNTDKPLVKLKKEIKKQKE